MAAIVYAEGLTESERFAHWHDLTCRSISQTECRRLTNDRFSGAVTSWTVGSLEFSELHSHSLYFRRDRREIRRDDCDDFSLTLMLEGAMELLQNERSVMIGPGDLVLYDQGSPFQLNYPGRYRTILVQIPRSHLKIKVPNLQHVTARPIRASSRYGQFAKYVVQDSIPLTRSPTPTIAEWLQTSIMALVAGIFDEEAILGAARAHKQDLLLSRLKSYMLANLANPTLTIDQIAAAHDISRRTLNRLFSVDDTTPMRWLWTRRLEASYEALKGGRAATVTEAAFCLGFNDVSHFSRTFKQAFGVSPKSVLKRNAD